MEPEKSLIVPDGKSNLEYPSNSFKSKETKESVKPVAHGKKVSRRKSIGERISSWLFVNEDEYYDFVYEDIIRPAFLDMLSDLSNNVIETVRDAVSVALWGSIGGARRRGTRYYRSSYDDEYWNRERRSRRRDSDRQDRDSRRSRSDDVAAIVETREEAVNLIKVMQTKIRDYNVASVLNFYEYADMPTKSTDDDYGWDLAHPFEASISRNRDGYIVEPNSPIWLDR